MNTHRQPTYGLHETSRNIARRVQRAWDKTENPPRAPVLPSLSILPPLIFRRTEKRPLAA